MKSIFLSASIPTKDRDKKYMESADIVAIRDAVIELVKVCLSNQIRIVWGGHPAITPLIYEAIKLLFPNKEPMSLIQQYVHIYQSRFFEQIFPLDNNQFQNIFLIDSEKDKAKSLYTMRKAMLASKDFIAGIFIGGMEGVEDEYKMFCSEYPNALRLPIASTGAAALHIYNSLNECFDEELEYDYAYNSLFTKYLLAK